MRRSLLLAIVSLAFSACAPSALPAAPEPVAVAEPDPAPQPPRAAAFSDADLHGRWRIVSLDGRPLQQLAEDSSNERTPQIGFTPYGYGGNSGCNSFGGLGLLHGDRYYAGSAMQTAIGCGDLTAQEEAITGLIAASPRLSRNADGSLTLADGRRTMVLRRDPGLGQIPPAPPWSGTAVLAGTSWTIGGVDGRWLRDGQRRLLRFEAERWSLTGPCGPMGGEWRQRGDAIVATAAPATRTCPAEAAALDSAIAASLSAGPRFVTGPNGEILIGGGGHWLTGERPRTPLADDAPLLAGNWRIVGIDGAPPLAGTEPRIAFGPTGYSGSAGCNGLQGYYLAHARHFFSPPPTQTEMACGPVSAQEERVGKVLVASPRIALAGDDELALVAENGSLRLTRDGATPWAPEGRPWTGAPLEAELTMLNALPLQNHYSEPETRLRLSAQRFDIETGCGRFGGIWRRRDGQLEFFTDPEPDPSGACAGALARHLPLFSRLFNGPARVMIGASGELLIAGEHHWLAGRVLRPSRRR